MVNGIIHILFFFWSWLYEHGIELVSAIVTTIAFLFTFANVIWTNYKFKLEEQNKNIKTLNMIDLLTKEERKNMESYANSLTHTVQQAGDMDEYLIVLPFTYKVLKSKNKKAKVIEKRIECIIEKDVKKELENYVNVLKENINNNHVNLNLQSLEKVTDKISWLNEAIDLSENLSNTERIYQDISAENEFSPDLQTITNRLYYSYDRLIEVLKKSSRSLVE